MTDSRRLSLALGSGELDKRLTEIYGDGPDTLKEQKDRYRTAIARFAELFGEQEIEIYSAPGRTEIGGNHTDHQHGMVLAASIDLDGIAVVAPVDGQTIEVYSNGYGMIKVEIDDLAVRDAERETTSALIRGVAAGLSARGYAVGAFKAYVSSDVINGAGLSSSASFEALIGTIISGLFNEGRVSSTEIAIVGQYAENVYFGKPCGLMDQVACSVGGLVYIDFNDPAQPLIERVDFDFDRTGYRVAIVDSRASHADLTSDYAEIPSEMKAVARFFDQSYLRDVPEDHFYANIASLRESVSDRAILRALHFFDEDRRVAGQVAALKAGDFAKFLRLIAASGNSSFKYLQNVYTNRNVSSQPIALALAVSEHILKADGVVRIHGGGFAGTILAFIRVERVAEYRRTIEEVFGPGSCHVLRIRKQGGIKVI